MGKNKKVSEMVNPDEAYNTKICPPKKKKSKKKTKEEIVQNIDIDSSSKKRKKKHSKTAVDSGLDDEGECGGVTHVKHEKKQLKKSSIDENFKSQGLRKKHKKRGSSIDNTVSVETSDRQKPKKSKKKRQSSPVGNDNNVTRFCFETVGEDSSKKERKGKRTRDIDSEIVNERTTGNDVTISKEVDSGHKVEICSDTDQPNDMGDSRRKTKKKKKRKMMDDNKVVVCVNNCETQAQENIISKKENHQDDLENIVHSHLYEPPKKKAKKMKNSPNVDKDITIEVLCDDGDSPSKRKKTKKKHKNKDKDDTMECSDDIKHGDKLSKKNKKKVTQNEQNKNVVLGCDERSTAKEVGSAKIKIYSDLSSDNNKKGFGQWGSSDIGNKDRQNKFMRLLGGLKKSNSETNLPLKKFNMAMNKDQQASFNAAQENKFESARLLCFSGQKGGGLGYEIPPEQGKKFYIDTNKSHSMKFN